MSSILLTESPDRERILSLPPNVRYARTLAEVPSLMREENVLSVIERGLHKTADPRLQAFVEYFLHTFIPEPVGKEMPLSGIADFQNRFFNILKTTGFSSAHSDAVDTVVSYWTEVLDAHLRATPGDSEYVQAFRFGTNWRTGRQPHADHHPVTLSSYSEKVGNVGVYARSDYDLQQYSKGIDFKTTDGSSPRLYLLEQGEILFMGGEQGHKGPEDPDRLLEKGVAVRWTMMFTATKLSVQRLYHEGLRDL